MLFLAEGRHGPVEPDEGARLARALHAALAERRADGSVLHAWARAGGGRVMVLAAEAREGAEAVLAGLPAPDSQEWALHQLTDLEEGLAAYLATLDAAEDGA